ncbi:hypothetical protein DPMN_059474 [Dreissena polymorpha]|uniref:Uncharacterized protein n=1 Tax=Dreissena polymorpha TaxID=45954 RepID=A0A9D4C438_DREPO|nr:hypothetical protein DPMN_059474 [Dreissena polymorpha]
MNIDSSKSAIRRNDVVFKPKSILASGKFANIYKAKYKGKKVVAKTLKSMLQVIKSQSLAITTAKCLE